MTALLTSTHYPAIRAALEVTLTAKELPDATIALNIYLGAAIAEVLARDPIAESRTGAALTHCENAGILFCAALLAPALPAITGEQTKNYQYSQKATDWSAQAAQLRKRAELELAAVLTPTEVAPERPTMFARVSGRRG